MEETKSVLSDQQKLFQEELFSIISPEIFEKQKATHLIAGQKMLQYRLGLL